jgi:hypothetical protein
VDVRVEFEGKTDSFRLHRDQATDGAPITFTEHAWGGFVFRRVGDDAFVVIRRVDPED